MGRLTHTWRWSYERSPDRTPHRPQSTRTHPRTWTSRCRCCRFLHSSAGSQQAKVNKSLLDSLPSPSQAHIRPVRGFFRGIRGIYQKKAPDAVHSVLMRVLILMKNSTSVRYSIRGRRRGPAGGCYTTTSGCVARICNNAYRTVGIVYPSSPLRRRRFLSLAGSLLPELWIVLASPLSKLSERELTCKFKSWSMVFLPPSPTCVHVHVRAPTGLRAYMRPFGGVFPQHSNLFRLLCNL